MKESNDVKTILLEYSSLVRGSYLKKILSLYNVYIVHSHGKFMLNVTYVSYLMLIVSQNLTLIGTQIM